MSNGLKDMFERLEEERHTKQLANLCKQSDNYKLRTVLDVIQNLNNLKATNPSLTEHGWYYINESIKALNDLIED